MMGICFLVMDVIITALFSPFLIVSTYKGRNPSVRQGRVFVGMDGRVSSRNSSAMMEI